MSAKTTLQDSRDKIPAADSGSLRMRSAPSRKVSALLLGRPATASSFPLLPSSARQLHPTKPASRNEGRISHTKLGPSVDTPYILKSRDMPEERGSPVWPSTSRLRAKLFSADTLPISPLEPIATRVSPTKVLIPNSWS